jgi:hypothetical protein
MRSSFVQWPVLPVHKQHAVRTYEEFKVRSACSQPRLLTKISGRDQAPTALLP